MAPTLSAIAGNDFGEYWLVVDKFYHDKFYPQDYAEKLAAFLMHHNRHNVLDAACGIGFPALELVKYNLDLTCSDGNQSMLDVFRKRAAEQQVDIPIKHSTWMDLPNTFDKKFDAVLCLDSSITYVDSWAKTDGDLAIPEAKQHITESLRSFYNVLAPSGMLIVGLAKYAFEKGSSYTVDYGIKKIEGTDVHHKWDIRFDVTSKRKTWKLITEWEDKKDIREYQSYMLFPDELRQMLKDVGFGSIERKEIVPGEYDYNFVALKN